VERIMPEVAVLVGPDIRVTIDNVRINAVQSPTSDQCFGVVASVAERLRLTDVTLYLGDDPDATGCMLGLSAADGTQVTLDRTDLYLHRGTPSPDTRGYGVCASDMNQVTLFDSNVQFGEGYNVDGASFSEAAAMTLENVGALHVSRSRVQIANGPTTASADRVFGVIGSVRGTAHFDNSLIRTLNGGVENDAIRLSAPTALLPSYSFYFVTAIAGLDDTSSEELADDEHQGAALRLEGLVSSLTSYNSWFVHAAGHGANARRHSLDFSGVTGRICTIAARNNALQVARYSTGPRIGRSTAHIFLADTEFSNFLYDINAPYSWGADTCPSPSLEIGDNVGLAEPNNDAGPGGDSNTRVAGIDDDGKIDVVVEGADTWTQSADMLRTSGRPYPMVPYGGINLDVDRQDRGDSTTAIGAYEYPDNTM
jgi:hypothetical protein